MQSLTAPRDESEERAESSVQKLQHRFSEFVEVCSEFSREIIQEAGWNGGPLSYAESVPLNLQISRAVFGKWSLDILAFLYFQRSGGFQEIRRALGPISSRVLSTKLARMQEIGLARREVKPTRPPRVLYALTERGLAVAKLGEPVFLYLRLGGTAESGSEAKSVEP